MSATTGQIEWYIARDGQQHGPLTEAELEKFVEFGHLKPTDLLWRAGFPDWRPAAEVFPPKPAETARPDVPPEPYRPVTREAQARQTEPGGPDPAKSPGASAEADSARGRGATHDETMPLRHAVQGVGQSREPRRDPGAADAAADRGMHDDAGNGTRPAHRPVQRRAEGATDAGQRQASAFEPGRPGREVSETDLRAQWSMAEARLTSGAHQEGPGGNGDAFSRPAADFRAPPHGAFAAPEADFEPAGPDFRAPRAGVAPHRGRDLDDAEFDEDEDYADEDERGSSWLGIAATILILALIGAGGWYAYNNQAQIVALYSDLVSRSSDTNGDVAIVRAPEEASREAAGGPAPRMPTATISQPIVPGEATGRPERPARTDRPGAAAALSSDLPDVPLLRSDAWSFAEREFSAWTERQAEKVREMAAANASAAEINSQLVAAFVAFRRDNAALALLASSERLEQIASAFVQSLQALTARGPESCYAFISSGEGTAALAPVYFEPSIGGKIEVQMLAIMSAIVDARNKPTARQPPRAEDFDRLSAELSERGWSEADLKLFSNPDALSRAEPQTVCRLVTEWFATQTALADAEARDRLIAASLRPVIGG